MNRRNESGCLSSLYHTLHNFFTQTTHTLSPSLSILNTHSLTVPLSLPLSLSHTQTITHTQAHTFSHIFTTHVPDENTLTLTFLPNTLTLSYPHSLYLYLSLKLLFAHTHRTHKHTHTHTHEHTNTKKLTSSLTNILISKINVSKRAFPQKHLRHCHLTFFVYLFYYVQLVNIL